MTDKVNNPLTSLIKRKKRRWQKLLLSGKGEVSDKPKNVSSLGTDRACWGTSTGCQAAAVFEVTVDLGRVNGNRPRGSATELTVLAECQLIVWSKWSLDCHELLINFQSCENVNFDHFCQSHFLPEFSWHTVKTISLYFCNIYLEASSQPPPRLKCPEKFLVNISQRRIQSPRLWFSPQMDSLHFSMKYTVCPRAWGAPFLSYSSIRAKTPSQEMFFFYHVSQRAESLLIIPIVLR